MNKYRSLSYEERIVIAALRDSGFSIRAIAGKLQRSPNTVSRELRKKKVKGIYDPKKAQRKTYWKRYIAKRGCLKAVRNWGLGRIIEEKLLLNWSPERISGYLRLNGFLISKKSIYKYVHARCLERYLFWKRNKRKGGPKYGKNKKTDDGRKYIELRPVLEGSGHYEADFIVSGKSSASLLVTVDRYTRETFVKKLPNRKRLRIEGAFKEIFKSRHLKTLTLDNDIAFNGWKKLEEILKTKIYFTHPYHSWEKGLVENTNRWIRCFVPKKRDIATVSYDECRSIENYLNSVPRKCLGFKSANEVSSTLTSNH